MILTNKDILEYIEKGKIEIDPLEEDQIGPASVDLTLWDRWWFFKNGLKRISTMDNWEGLMEMEIKEKVVLKPQEMCLGITKEKIKLDSDVCGILQGRSRFARLGLSVHITSSFIHPGVNNRQVLEIVNNSPYEFELNAGDRISQVIFIQTKSKTTKPYEKFGKIAINQ